MEEETWILHGKVTLSQWLWETYFFSKCNRFFFHLSNTKLCAAPLNYNCRALQVSPHGINSDLSDNGCSSVSPASAFSSPWYLAPPYSHIQKEVMPECIDMEMLFLLHFCNRNQNISVQKLVSNKHFCKNFF